jgi:PcfJ-like protein
VTWGPSSIAPFAHEEGIGDERRVFEVSMLLGTTELIEEGKAMQHCVATYARACESGRTSIWSLRMRLSCGRLVRLATVEVRTSDRMIVQVRKRANKAPTHRELSILRKWADRGGPRLHPGC